MMRRALAMGALAVAVPAQAEVKSATAAGFETVNRQIVGATPEQVYAMLVQPARWWDKAHTYSGDSANLMLEPKAGGCFCEKIPADGATIEHARIVYTQPGKTLRMVGALGPLQQEGVSAALTWAFKPVPGGTEITQTYVVGGYIRGGADRLAPIVDQVLGGQLKALQAVFAKR